MSKRRRFARWFERAVLGFVMTVMAAIIERRVLKAIRDKELQPEPKTGELAPERQL